MNFTPNSSATFLIANISNKKYDYSHLDFESKDILLYEVYFDKIDYASIKGLLLRFFQSDIRERNLSYLLD